MVVFNVKLSFKKFIKHIFMENIHLRSSLTNLIAEPEMRVVWSINDNGRDITVAQFIWVVSTIVSTIPIINWLLSWPNIYHPIDIYLSGFSNFVCLLLRACVGGMHVECIVFVFVRHCRSQSSITQSLYNNTKIYYRLL